MARSFIGRSVLLLTILLALAVVAVGPFAHRAQAYEKDTHYYFTFVMALQVSCFSWNEAHLIASGDWGLDVDSDTVAEIGEVVTQAATRAGAGAVIPVPGATLAAFYLFPIQTPKQNKWHALWPNSAAGKTSLLAQRNALWNRQAQEADLPTQLVKLGQFLHYAQDIHSHAFRSFNPANPAQFPDLAKYSSPLGHAKDSKIGKDPDSIAETLNGSVGSGPGKSQFMAKRSMEALRDKCIQLGRWNDGLQTQFDATLAPGSPFMNLIDNLVRNSDPRWMTIGFGKDIVDGIVTVNKQQMELYLKADLGQAKLQQKGAPNPADPKIPDLVKIEFDADGNILNQLPYTLGDLVMSGMTSERCCSDVVIKRWSIDWSGIIPIITAILRNIGNATSAAANLWGLGYNPDTEIALGAGGAAVPSMEPGGEETITLPMPGLTFEPGMSLGIAYDGVDGNADDNYDEVAADSSVGGTFGLRGGGTPSTQHTPVSGGPGAAPIAAWLAGGLLTLAVAGWYVQRRFSRG